MGEARASPATSPQNTWALRWLLCGLPRSAFCSSHRLLCAAPTRVQPAGHAAACLAALRCPDTWAAFGGVASLCCGGADAYCFAVALRRVGFFYSFFFREKRILSACSTK